MIVYWIGCLSSVLVAWFGAVSEKGRRHKYAVAFFSALPLFLIAAFRYNVGRDYLNTYVSYFKLVQEHLVNDRSRLEILFHLTNRLIAVLGGGYETLFIVCAVLFFVPLFLQIYDDSPYPALSIFLLFAAGYYFVSFNAMRQMIGSAICLYAVRYIEKRRLKSFLFWVLIAIGFHKSCVVFIPVYWMARMRIRCVHAVILTTAFILFRSAVSGVFRAIVLLTPYKSYVGSVFDTGTTAYVILAINIVLLVFSSLCYQKDNPKFQIYYNLQIAAVIVTAYSGEIVLFLRMLWLFGLPSVVAVPMALSYIPNKKSQRLIAAAIVLIYFIYISYTVGIQNSNDVLPYQTVLTRW